MGPKSEADVILEGKRVKMLIDSGAQISTISKGLVDELGLEIKQLNSLLTIEGTGGGEVPYLGFVEGRMKIPRVVGFDEDVLLRYRYCQMYISQLSSGND